MAELELAIDCCPDQKAHKRLNTTNLLLCGGGFELALRHARVSERCLQKWIERFNAHEIRWRHLLSPPWTATLYFLSGGNGEDITRRR